MKHSKDRLSPREWAGGILAILSWIPLSAVNADKLWQLVAALTIAVGALAIGAVILNWPEIKNYLRR